MSTGNPQEEEMGSQIPDKIRDHGSERIAFLNLERAPGIGQRLFLAQNGR